MLINLYFGQFNLTKSTTKLDWNMLQWLLLLFFLSLFFLWRTITVCHMQWLPKHPTKIFSAFFYGSICIINKHNDENKNPSFTISVKISTGTNNLHNPITVWIIVPWNSCQLQCHQNVSFHALYFEKLLAWL